MGSIAVSIRVRREEFSDSMSDRPIALLDGGAEGVGVHV